MTKSIYDQCVDCLSCVFTFDYFDVMTVTGDTALFKPINGGDNAIGDSLDQVEFIIELEDQFAVEIPDHEADKINTLKDAEACIKKLKK